MEDFQREEELRQPIMAFFQGKELLEADVVVIGFGLVIEMIDVHGGRHIRKITSDGSGRPVPWYMSEMYGKVLADVEEIEDTEDDLASQEEDDD